LTRSSGDIAPRLFKAALIQPCLPSASIRISSTASAPVAASIAASVSEIL